MADKPFLPIPWLDENKTRARRSRKHEDRIADKLGGRRQRRSGGAPWSRYDTKTTEGRDITTDIFFIEHKRTDKKSMSIKREWLDKIREAALMGNRDPGVIITFEDTSSLAAGTDRNEDWALIPIEVLQRLIGKEDK